MPCQEWFDLVEHYRAAVHGYGDAVDHFRGESATDPEGAWRHTEHARRAVDKARSALLFHERNHNCFAARKAAARAFFESTTDEMILGDQGQSGG